MDWSKYTGIGLMFLFIAMGFISGYVSAQNNFETKDGIHLNCNKFTLKSTNPSYCEIKINGIKFESNFDEVVIPKNFGSD